MIPPAKVSSASSFLGQEEVRSAGTVGTGYVTAGSATMEEQPVEVEQPANEDPQASGAERFSPQQARRLREMEQEAPLLYSERRTEQPQEDSGAARAPPLPHYSSSESGQAEAIQAEVRRQMQAFMVVQSELQGRVAALVEENQMLRQVAWSNVDSVSGGSGLHAAKGSWFSGLRRNLMGFVQQVPGTAQFDGGYAPQVTGWTSSPGPSHEGVQASGHVEGQERHAAPPSTGAKGQRVPVPALEYSLGPPPTPSALSAARSQQVPVASGVSPAPFLGLGSIGVPKTTAAGPSTGAGATGGNGNPLEVMMSGIVQLQGVVADLASRSASTSSSAGGGPEVARPGVQELVKLPPPTLEGALGFSDWIHAVKPSMSDLSDTSGECWRVVLEEAREWYNDKFVPSTPIARVRLRVPESKTDREPRWSRVKHRMEHLIIQACSDSVRAELSSARVSGVLNILCKLHIIYKPGGVAERSEALKQVQHPKPADSAIDAVLKLRTWKRWMTRLSDLGGAQPDAALSLQALECITGNVLRSLPSLNLVRASLHLDTQPTGAKVSEYFEHLLVELEAVSRVAEGPSPSLSLGAKTEANKNVRQVDARVAGGNDTSPAAPKEARSPKGAGQAAGGDSPKKLCKWFHEAKGCKRGKDCKFTHDWSQVPKQDRADRCMACGAKGHRRDACPNTQGTGLAKRDDGASSAKSARADPAQKSKADPGLRKVLSDAAGVLREAIHASGGAADPAAHQPPSAGGSARGGGSEAGTCAEGPAMAAAAKIQAQLEDLEARVLDGRGPAVRAVSGAAEAVNSEQTALLDSGATHAELDVASAEGQDLVPCTVSLAGHQRQTWKQTPGGSLVAPSTGEGTTQTILPLGCLVDQLDCSVRWSKKGGMHLTHPRLGRLKTSLKGGCPQLNREQAMCLIKELESAKLGELTSRLKKVQAYLTACKD